MLVTGSSLSPSEPFWEVMATTIVSHNGSVGKMEGPVTACGNCDTYHTVATLLTSGYLGACYLFRGSHSVSTLSLYYVSN